MTMAGVDEKRPLYPSLPQAAHPGCSGVPKGQVYPTRPGQAV